MKHYAEQGFGGWKYEGRRARRVRETRERREREGERGKWPREKTAERELLLLLAIFTYTHHTYTFTSSKRVTQTVGKLDYQLMLYNQKCGPLGGSDLSSRVEGGEEDST